MSGDDGGESLNLGGLLLNRAPCVVELGVGDLPDVEGVQVGEELLRDLLVEPIDDDRRAGLAGAVGAGVDARRGGLAPLARLATEL